MVAVDFREKLLCGLGGEWPQPCALNVRLHRRIPGDRFTIESLFYDVEPDDPVSALLLVPDGVSAARPAPAVAVWHQHAGQSHLGKSEPAGLDGDPMHHTGGSLVRSGYVVLCPDGPAARWIETTAGSTRPLPCSEAKLETKRKRRVLRLRQFRWENV